MLSRVRQLSNFVLCRLALGLVIPVQSFTRRWVSTELAVKGPSPKDHSLLNVTQETSERFERHAFAVPQKTIACIGDSITMGTCAGSKNSYPELMQTKLGEAYNVHKFAACGHSVSKKHQQPIWDEKALLDEAMASMPEIVVIMFGTNDAKSETFSASAYKEDYTKLIKMFKGISSNPKVYLMIPPPVYNVSNPNLEFMAPNVNLRLGLLLGEIAASNDLAAPIDLFSAFKSACPNLNGTCSWMDHRDYVGERARFECDEEDTIHPSDAGYEHIAEIVADVIACQSPHGIKESATCKMHDIMHRLGIGGR